MSTVHESQISRAIQNHFPLVRDPWAALEQETGVRRDDVMLTVRGWADEGRLREVSAVFEGEVLGYESALVAAHVPRDRVTFVAEAVSRHPTVTHCYERFHSMNLWFTIAVPPSMGLRRTLSMLEAECGVDAGTFIPLRRGKTFKIGVAFDFDRKANDTTVSLGDTSARLTPSTQEIAMIRALQTPLSLVDSPFDELAANAGVDPEELLQFARRMLGRGMRRYVATFRHRKIGVAGNGMVVWRAQEEEVDALGTFLAATPEVSHCYSRPAFPGFPYTVYSMLHGPSEEAVRERARELSRTFGAIEHEVLQSTREHKKCRLRYFLPELDGWWAARQGAVS